MFTAFINGSWSLWFEIKTRRFMQMLASNRLVIEVGHLLCVCSVVWQFPFADSFWFCRKFNQVHASYSFCKWKNNKRNVYNKVNIYFTIQRPKCMIYVCSVLIGGRKEQLVVHLRLLFLLLLNDFTGKKEIKSLPWLSPLLL